ncbi:MAG: XdhC family protein [Solirubrobacteraceae bacterium]
MTAAVSRRAEELVAQGVAFVTATVVRAQHPTSAQAGNVALVLGDGTIEGFVGGVCAEHSVRVYSLKAIETNETVLLRILPVEGGNGDGAAEAADSGQEISSEQGAVTVQNHCLSGGAIEVFLEPVLPAPRALVVGDTPIARAVRQLGVELGLEVVAVHDGSPEPAAGDLGLLVASHGRDELHALRRGLETGVAYVGLVASPRRGSGVIAELRRDGVSEELLERIDVPAGIEIGALTPAEVAVSILAKLVAVRRGNGTTAGAPEVAPAPAAVSSSTSTRPVISVDPICGMTVAAVPGTPSVEHDGETIYFCCEGCKAKFEAQHEHASTVT